MLFHLLYCSFIYIVIYLLPIYIYVHPTSLLFYLSSHLQFAHPHPLYLLHYLFPLLYMYVSIFCIFTLSSPKMIFHTFLAKTTFSSLHFHAIPTLVWSLSFLFHHFHFYSLFRKTRLVLVISVSALKAKSYVANETIKIIIIKIYFGIKKCHVNI